MKFCLLLFISMFSVLANAELYIFVSHSMNDKALQAYYKEAQSLRAKLVVRGLIDDSFLETKAKLDDLSISYDIDPNLFEKYDVQVVPTIVRDQNNRQSKVVGHIPLIEALKIFDNKL
jgi:conjugal transfer pilus assembly protein TrbC